MSGSAVSTKYILCDIILKPLAVSFEYLKDSNDYLVLIETIKEISAIGNWDWRNIILFIVDVKALYPFVILS